MSLLTSEFGVSVSFDVPLSHFGFDETNLVQNPEFYIPGDWQDEDDVFEDWTESKGTYADILIAVNPVSDYAEAGRGVCKIRTICTDCDAEERSLITFEGHVYQSISVVPGEAYRLAFSSKVSGDGFTAAQGRFAIYDETNSDWIVSRRQTGLFSSQNWGRTSIYFNTPPTCSTVRIYFYQNTTTELGNETVNYALVTLQKRTAVERAPVPSWGGSGSLGSYRHTNSVNIGYDSMQLTTAGTEEYVAEWLENGLARRVLVAYGGTLVWEGFVNEISARVGGSTLTAGPLMGVVNRGQMVYKGVNFGVSPAVTVPGGSLKSEWIDNIDSQGKFGVLEGKITGGEGLADEMSQMLQTIVAGTSWPDISQSINIGSSTDMAITISCLGYGHMLDKFYYTQTGLAGFYDIDQKILDTIAADPNNIFTVGNTSIVSNETQVEKYEDSDRTALAILKDLASLGDEDYNRHVFGVFANRKLFYWNAVEREIQYYLSVRNNRITTADGAIVQPWEVNPGEWVNIFDLIPGSPAIAEDYRRDPRMLFIESVTYTAPYGLALSGGRASKFKQKIESLGLGGF
jgi:hypothetical protein